MNPEQFAKIKVTQSDIDLWQWCKTAIRESANWRQDDAATNEHLFRLDTQGEKLLAAHRRNSASDLLAAIQAVEECCDRPSKVWDIARAAISKATD